LLLDVKYPILGRTMGFAGIPSGDELCEHLCALAAIDRAVLVGIGD
jgi:hypothetical protein